MRIWNFEFGGIMLIVEVVKVQELEDEHLPQWAWMWILKHIWSHNIVEVDTLYLVTFINLLSITTTRREGKPTPRPTLTSPHIIASNASRTRHKVVVPSTNIMSLMWLGFPVHKELEEKSRHHDHWGALNNADFHHTHTQYMPIWSHRIPNIPSHTTLP